MTAPASTPGLRSERAQSLPRTLVSLKVRLLANRAAASRRGQRQLAIAAIAAAAFGVGGALYGFGVARSSDQITLRTALVVGASLLTVGWAVLPLSCSGSTSPSTLGAWRCSRCRERL